jgi:predicted aspartyl protease
VSRIPLIIAPDPADPDCATVMVDGTVAGRPYRFILDTGAVRTQIEADAYTSTLPALAGEVSSSVFGARADPVVTVTDVVVGPLHAPALDVTRVNLRRNVLGLDMLYRYGCLLRLSAGVLEVGVPAARQAGHILHTASTGHVYVDVCWPGIVARGCLDTGSGITVVNRDFWLAYPSLFEQVGVSVSTDATGTTLKTPVVLIAEAVIGGRQFGRHEAAVVDLSHANAALGVPMDVILGYPTLRQADWLLDFPNGRWAVLDPAFVG